jgi:hypothetical protein
MTSPSNTIRSPEPAVAAKVAAFQAARLRSTRRDLAMVGLMVAILNDGTMPTRQRLSDLGIADCDLEFHYDVALLLLSQGFQDEGR